MTAEHLILILDDDAGISAKAYDAVYDLVLKSGGEEGPMNDVLNECRATEVET